MILLGNNVIAIQKNKKKIHFKYHDEDGVGATFCMRSISDMENYTIDNISDLQHARAITKEPNFCKKCLESAEYWLEIALKKQGKLANAK